MAEHAFAPGDGVAHDGGIGVAQVRPRVHVIDGRGDVKLLALIHFPFPDRP